MVKVVQEYLIDFPKNNQICMQKQSKLMKTNHQNALHPQE